MRRKNRALTGSITREMVTDNHNPLAERDTIENKG